MKMVPKYLKKYKIVSYLMWVIMSSLSYWFRMEVRSRVNPIWIVIMDNNHICIKIIKWFIRWKSRRVNWNNNLIVFRCIIKIYKYWSNNIKTNWLRVGYIPCCWKIKTRFNRTLNKYQNRLVTIINRTLIIKYSIMDIWNWISSFQEKVYLNVKHISTISSIRRDWIRFYK